MLLQMAKILFYGWIVFHCTYIHHIFFIHSSAGGHLGCFHILATVNKAAVNIEVHVSFQISVFVFFRYIPRSGSAGSYGSSVFSFLGNILFSTAVAPVYVPTNSVWELSFLCILANSCYLWSFWWQPSCQVWGDISL